MFKLFAILLLIWSPLGRCNWFPGMEMVSATSYDFVFKGISSGIEYSQDSLSGCDFMTYLQNGQPLPEMSKKENRTCIVSLNARNKTWGGSWQGNGNCCNYSIRVRDALLYENRITTVGGLIRLASQLGLVSDKIAAKTTSPMPTNPNDICFYWSLYKGFNSNEGSGITNLVRIKDDGSCYRGQVTHPSCDIKESIFIDHGLVSSNKLKSGTAVARVNANLYCDYASDVVFRTNIINDLDLNPVNGTGRVKSKLYLNDQSLIVGDGVLFKAVAGNNPLVISSVLTGSNNPSGDFMGATVLVISMP